MSEYVETLEGLLGATSSLPQRTRQLDVARSRVMSLFTNLEATGTCHAGARLAFAEIARRSITDERWTRHGE